MYPTFGKLRVEFHSRISGVIIHYKERVFKGGTHIILPVYIPESLMRKHHFTEERFEFPRTAPLKVMLTGFPVCRQVHAVDPFMEPYSEIMDSDNVSDGFSNSFSINHQISLHNM
jgi:methionine synthase II (cobalamin-independent)